MQVILLVVEIWVAVNLVFIAVWFAVSARRRRNAVGDMVEAAERHANSTESGRALSRTG